jgi:hypothetical protein
MPLKAQLDGSIPKRRNSIIEHNTFIVKTMSDEKTGPLHSETAGGTGKRTFGQKFKRSCARFWWIYLFVFIAVVLVVVLPMYVDAPVPGPR